MQTEGSIIKKLKGHFANYEYQLQNSFVFLWESDFFCMSKSGYFVEVEVKCSRSDFFKDFEKDKHKIFLDASAGRSISVYKTGYNDKGDIAVKDFPHLSIECRGYRQPYLLNDIRRKIINGSEELIEATWHRRTGPEKQYIVNDWQDRLEIRRHHTRDLYYPATSIRYHKLNEIHFPNQLYYAAPKNMIKVNELPPYAGLLEIGERVLTTKRAPYIHKRKLDMDKVLLKKFYNLWKYRGNREPVNPNTYPGDA